MSLIRHKYFLKSVLLYSLQSFGGPQAHISYLLKYFAFEKKIVTEHEIQEYFSICQLLPGPSSTQVLALIALKRGGYLLASLTMLIWVLPATIIMASIALCLPLISQHHLIGFFKFIPLLAIAFIIDALYRVIKNYNFTYIRFIFFVIF
ncbi:MAG: chromate transporter, partial [Sediminibacterium sp.]|nr:chromate transporter [Sediminibacterium sp.]